MQIIIVGDGKVGYALAEQLSDAHDVVVVDRNDGALQKAAESLDVMCVRGNGASGVTLREAGVERADILIAATSGDEMNMLCCLTGKKLGARHTIARIRDPEYARDINMLKRELGIELVINPEQETAAEISRLLRFTGTSGIEHFSRGRVEIISAVLQPGDPLCRVSLSALRSRLPEKILFCGVERGDEVLVPHGDTVLQPGDKIYAIGTPAGLMAFYKQQGIQMLRVKDLMMIGGGRICRYLAQQMQRLGVSVKIIERDRAVCEQLMETLPDATVIWGDGTEQEILLTENIREMDAFVSLTDHDEDNLMAALFARNACGVPKVIAKSARQSYTSLMQNMGLAHIVSPKGITSGQIVRFVRAIENSGDSYLDARYPLADGKLTISEFTIGKSFPQLGRALKDIRLSPDVLIGAFVHQNTVIIPQGNTRLAEGDGVFLVSKNQNMKNLEEIFL